MEDLDEWPAMNEVYKHTAGVASSNLAARITTVSGEESHAEAGYIQSQSHNTHQ